MRIILFIFIFISMFCKSEEKTYERITCKGGKDNWGVKPEDIEQKPFNYFYFRANARASKESILKKDGAMIKKSCIEAASNGAKNALIRKMIGESLQGASGLSDDIESTGWLLVDEFMKKPQGVNVKECRSFSVINPNIKGSEYADCECIIYYYIEGGRDKIIQMARELEKNQKSK